MANLVDNNIWEAGIYQLEQTDVVLGGSTGISNNQAQQLANRTTWLKNALRGFNDFSFLSASKTLTIDDVLQKIIFINGNGSSQTYNLPIGLTTGTIVTIMAYNVTKQVTINSQGTNDIVMAGAFRQKLFLGDGETVSLVWVGDHWFLFSHDTQIMSVGSLTYGYAIKSNTVVANGQLLNRVSYPRLWEFAQTLGGSLIDDLTWNNAAGYKGFFSIGDNATTFRVPDLRGMFIRSLDLGAGIDFGRLSENPGGYEADDLRAHTHTVRVSENGTNNGSRQNPGWSDNENALQGNTPTSSVGGSETRPKNIGLIPLINI